LKPDYDLAVINLARTYRALRREDDALVGYRRFLEREPSNAHVRYELAQMLLERGELQAAEAELSDVLRREPAMAAARAAMGALRLKRGQIDDAEREIRAALALKPDIRMAHFHLAIVAESRRQPGAALEEYRKEIDLFPDNHMAHFNLGKLFEQQGDSKSQLLAFRKAIEANPQFAEGHLFLAKLLLDLGLDSDEAVRLARRGIQIDPGGSYAPLGHYVVADVLTRQGRAAEAAAEMQRGRALEARLRSKS
jgi:tetratricopeptide (TPR) repeat protein